MAMKEYILGGCLRWEVLGSGRESQPSDTKLFTTLWSFISLMVCMVTMFAHGKEPPAGFSDVYDHLCWGDD